MAILLSKYDKLPKKMQNEDVLSYFEILQKKVGILALKRIVDALLCGIIFIITLPFFLLFALLTLVTSRGGVFFRQERVGRNMKPFYILKFRTMIKDADKKGMQLTTGDDARITPFGKFLRKINMDEMPQLINVIKGDMSIIGTRPEVSRYVDMYSDEMLATLLIAPGMVSMASVKYKNENELLSGSDSPEKTYIDEILPDKMKYNLEYLTKISVSEDMSILRKTIACVFK